MSEQKLFDHYQIRPESILNRDGKKEYLSQNHRYFFDTIQFNEEEMQEMKMLSDYMYMQGETNVLRIVPSLEQSLVVKSEEERFVLLSSQLMNGNNRRLSEGEWLKERHIRGQSFPYPLQHQSRLGKWKEVWATRLEQMENFWYSRMYEQPSSTFEKWFLESFPYYLGLTENAIQYISDCEWEDKHGEMRQGTICTERYGNEGEEVRPWEWIYDHSARDIAEGLRKIYWEYGYPNCYNYVNEFLNGYESRGGITLSSWRMVYARLVFPQHYFECIENYYTSRSESYKERLVRELRHIIRNNEHYEFFLRDFYKNIGLLPAKWKIPTLHWL